jgi:hypothetical protein
MKPKFPTFPYSLLLLAASLLPASAADTNADQLLKQMSAKLASAGSFSFTATREIDVALLGGRGVPEKAKVSVAVQRPNKIAAVATSKMGTRRFVFDGSSLVLLDEKHNHYAKLPMRASIDGLVDQLDAKYGFVPPLAEFAVSNPYKEFKQQAGTVTYLGKSKTQDGLFGWFGVECHRVWLSGKDADAELWIGVEDQLPHKLTATFHLQGSPQLRVSFSKWDLAAPANSVTFTFTPPKGSQQIEMWTTARMKSAAKH